MASCAYLLGIGSRVRFLSPTGEGSGNGEVLERSVWTDIKIIYYVRYKRCYDGRTIEMWFDEDDLFPLQ